MKNIAFLVMMLAVTAAGMANAQERRIIVDGTGTAEAAPDMATITLGVTNENTEAAAAMQATSEAVAQILSRLEQAGLEARDIQTRDLSLSPLWGGRDIQNGDRQKITGFVASNRVFVRVRDLSNLGPILDTVIEGGTNDFGGLSFSVQDPKPLAAKARADAVADAREKAGQLAEAAGVELGQVVSITVGGGGPRPLMRVAEFAAADAGGIPVAGGEISVQATVSMVFEIAE